MWLQYKRSRGEQIRPLISLYDQNEEARRMDTLKKTPNSYLGTGFDVHRQIANFIIESKCSQSRAIEHKELCKGWSPKYVFIGGLTIFNERSRD